MDGDPPLPPESEQPAEQNGFGEDWLDRLFRENVDSLGDAILDEPYFGDQIRFFAVLHLYRHRQGADRDGSSPALRVADLRAGLIPLSPTGIRRVLEEMETAGLVERVADGPPASPTTAWAWIHDVPLPPWAVAELDALSVDFDLDDPPLL